MNAAIIVAAGSSRRMGDDKLFADLCGRPVLAHTIEAFQNSKLADTIIVVTRPEKMEEICEWKGRYDKLKEIVEGGPERCESVWRGLECLSANTQYVAVHDGARPLISPTMIDRCFEMVQEKKAMCCAVPVVDTLKRGDEALRISESVSRENLWAMQTPQVFEFQLLQKAYRAAFEQGIAVTDETSAVDLLGVRVSLLHNTQINFKITFPQDLEMARCIIEARNKKNCLL